MEQTIYDHTKLPIYIELFREFYTDRDISHGLEHVIKVAYNALYIAYQYNQISIEEYNIILISALGHDIWDHKYVKDPDTIIERFITVLRWANVSNYVIRSCIDIIDTISLSKELENGRSLYAILPERLLLLRNIVSDADKLESLGAICVYRMVHYELNTIKDVDLDHIVRHIKEHSTKLYKIYTEGYMNTRIGKILAKPKYIELYEIIEDETILKEFITLSSLHLWSPFSKYSYNRKRDYII